MNDKQIADRLSGIIDDRVEKATESLTLQIATQNNLIAELRETIEVVKGFGLDTVASIDQMKSDLIESQIRILEYHKTQDEGIALQIDAIEETTASAVSKTEQDLTDFLNLSAETIELKLANTQNTELLRLNDHINQKLNLLKGDKGDSGEKGDKGESGFLSGVSEWKNGDIAKQNEARTFENGLWLCKVSQTASPPSLGDSWDLVVEWALCIKAHTTPSKRI